MTDEERPDWSYHIREAIYEELRDCWQADRRADATLHLNNAIYLLYLVRCPGEDRRIDVHDRTVAVQRNN